MDEKIRIAAYVDAKHRMSLTQTQESIIVAKHRVDVAKDELEEAKAILAGYQEALKEKNEGLK